MNREIKFRAQRWDTGKWVYGFYFETPLTDENSGMPPEAGWFFLTGGGRAACIGQDGVAFKVLQKTVGQFTGLKDKNGRDIYGGDVVTHYDYLRRKLIVEYISPSFELRDTKDDTVRPMWHNGCLTDYKIIGNIYENPELLSS